MSKKVALAVALFLLTVWSTSEALGLLGGLTLMSILLAHEMGHWVVARRHGVPASLPYFIPVPKIFLLGTMGAIITMRSDKATRNQLLDIGAAGPIAGFIVAVPAMIAGIMMSEVKPVAGSALYFGDSILSWLMIEVIAPARPPGTDLIADPVLIAAWGGFVVTALNLIPIGQLDGGHVMYALAPDRSHRRMTIAYRVLLLLGFAGLAVALPQMLSGALDLPPVFEQVTAPLRRWFAPMFLIWALLAKRTGLHHPPVVDETEPLTPGRRWIAITCFFIFLMTFMPSPAWYVSADDARPPASGAPAPGGGG